MQILVLLGMYFDAAVVFVTNSFRFQIAYGHTVHRKHVQCVERINPQYNSGLNGVRNYYKGDVT